MLRCLTNPLVLVRRSRRRKKRIKQLHGEFGIVDWHLREAPRLYFEEKEPQTTLQKNHATCHIVACSISWRMVMMALFGVSSAGRCGACGQWPDCSICSQHEDTYLEPTMMVVMPQMGPRDPAISELWTMILLGSYFIGRLHGFPLWWKLILIVLRWLGARSFYPSISLKFSRYDFCLKVWSGYERCRELVLNYFLFLFSFAQCPIHC